MVLEVLSDPRKMLYHRDAEGTQRGSVADTRMHEHLGRIDRAQGEDDFASGPNAEGLAVMDKLHAGGAPTLERHFYDPGLPQHCEVRPIHVGEGVGAKDGLPSSITDQDVDD